MNSIEIEEQKPKVRSGMEEKMNLSSLWGNREYNDTYPNITNPRSSMKSDDEEEGDEEELGGLV